MKWSVSRAYKPLVTNQHWSAFALAIYRYSQKKESLPLSRSLSFAFSKCLSLFVWVSLRFQSYSYDWVHGEVHVTQFLRNALKTCTRNEAYGVRGHCLDARRFDYYLSAMPRKFKMNTEHSVREFRKQSHVIHVLLFYICFHPFRNKFRCFWRNFEWYIIPFGACNCCIAMWTKRVSYVWM